MAKDIEYSEKYVDEHFEYRHVILPKSLKSEVPRNRLMLEEEWRAIGVTQSRGWMQYMIHAPEPHILLFRRPIRTDPRTGRAPSGWTPPKAGISEEEAKCWFADPSQHKIKIINPHSDHHKNKKKNNYNQQNKENQNMANKYY